MFKLAGKRPTALGVSDGRLQPCAAGSGCIGSQTQAGTRGDPGPQHVHPFKYAGLPGDAMTRLLAVLLAQPRCRIVSQTHDYLHAEFESAVLGLVSDFEFLLAPAEQVIHVRAAARYGFADFGAGRARVEDLRIAFDEAD